MPRNFSKGHDVQEAGAHARTIRSPFRSQLFLTGELRAKTLIRKSDIVQSSFGCNGSM